MGMQKHMTLPSWTGYGSDLVQMMMRLTTAKSEKPCEHEHLQRPWNCLRLGLRPAQRCWNFVMLQPECLTDIFILVHSKSTTDHWLRFALHSKPFEKLCSSSQVCHVNNFQGHHIMQQVREVGVLVLHLLSHQFASPAAMISPCR